MVIDRLSRSGVILRGCGLVFLGLGSLTLAPKLLAQAVVEAAGTTSVSSGVAAAAKPMPMPKTLPTGDSQVSPHIVASTKAPEVETNRHALEANAGPDAARLLVRSLPSQAQVWINGKPVGMAPMLLIVPPGKYKIELRGTRQEIAQQEVALLPKETRELKVKLELRYPTRVVVH